VDPKDCKIIVQGFGNVGSISAELLEEQGAKIVGIGDISGSWYNPKGIKIKEAIQYVERNRVLEGFKGADKLTTAEKLLEMDCNVLVPAAKEDQITAENALKIKAKIIIEGANGPTKAEADDILRDKDILVVPDILANAGGVTVSYFEWVQNRQGYYWELERVNKTLERMMKDSFTTIFETSKKRKITLRIAAYVNAIDRVAKALKIRGIYA
jgi:glutamate dehydrogenase (NAD(P)+)